MKTGVELIAAERKRQVSAEGWTPEHDDNYTRGELADAAACYAASPFRRGNSVWDATIDDGKQRGDSIREFLWPWTKKWWKPTPDDRLRELVKAGALIAAEIDRLQRAAAAAK